MTLKEKAVATPRSVWTSKDFAERLELAIALGRNDVEAKQAAAVVGCTPSNVYQVLGAVLLRGMRTGLITVRRAA